MVRVGVQLVGSARQELELPQGGCLVDELRQQVGRAFNRPHYALKLVHKGMALPEDGKATVTLQDGDTLLAMPYRTAPPANIVSAAISARSGQSSRSRQEDEEDEEPDEPARLPAGAPQWEVKTVEALRSRGCPPWVMEWVLLVRPMRAALLLVFLLGCFISSRMGVGPVFILVSIMWCIFSNLSRRKAGDTRPSAYSIFNPGVQRLPGQLDADQIDGEIRQGRMG